MLSLEGCGVKMVYIMRIYSGELSVDGKQTQEIMPLNGDPLTDTPETSSGPQYCGISILEVRETEPK